MKRVAVIDCDGLCYVIGHPNKVLDEHGQPKRSEDGRRFEYDPKTDEQLIAACETVISDTLKACDATHYIMYMKGQNTIKARLQANPDYKGNRSAVPPLWWNLVQDTLQKSWGAIYVDDMEVDDAVNITRLELADSFIVASDGDLLGLEGTHYNWKNREWVTKTSLEARTKFWSDMVCGQTGDNIKGIPSKGPAFFARIYNAWEEAIAELPELVLGAYIDHFKEDEGIKEFYKNYVSLKILEKDDYFKVPQPIEFIKQSVEETTAKLFD